VLALLALGVRAVLADSFAPAFRRALIHHGVLPLRFLVDSDRRSIRDGDELEMPGLPEALEPNKPLVARNLTQGAQYTFHHDLSPGDIAVVRAGGLIRHTLEVVPEDAVAAGRAR
jgi:aconitate hydratase